MALTPFSLTEIVDRFEQVRVAVVGDFFLDQYLVIDPKLAEPSVETGLRANQVVAVRQSPGAAGTVVNNLSALEAGEIHAVGIIGDDGHGFLLRRELEARRVRTDRLLRDRRRFTPTYTKPMFQEPTGEVEGERIDIINRTPTPADLEDAVIQKIEEIAPQVDAVIVLDQVTSPNVGVITERVRTAICALARQHPKTVFYADSRAAIAHFEGVVTKPNEQEAISALGLTKGEVGSDELASQAGRGLFERTGREVFLTRGKKGILLTSSDGQVAVPTVSLDGPLDICGAGDSATAGIVLALCSGASFAQAALIGNLVASKTVVQIGTTGTTTRDAIKQTRIDSLLSVD